MRTYIEVSAEHRAALENLNEKLHFLCDKIYDHGEWCYCLPKAGNLIAVIQLLSKKGIEYQLEIQTKEI